MSYLTFCILVSITYVLQCFVHFTYFYSFSISHFYFACICQKSGGGDRGVGAWENRGWEWYGRWERKGQEVRVLRGWEVGEKCETLIFFNSTMRQNTFKNKNPKYIWLAFNIFSVTSETPEQMSKWKFVLGLKNKLTSNQIVNPFIVVTSWVMKVQAAWVHMWHVSSQIAKRWDEQAISNQCHPRQFY